MEIFKVLQQERDHYKEVCLRQDLKIEVIIISFGLNISIYLYIYIYLYIFNIYETCKSIYHNQFKYICNIYETCKSIYHNQFKLNKIRWDDKLFVHVFQIVILQSVKILIFDLFTMVFLLFNYIVT